MDSKFPKTPQIPFLIPNLQPNYVNNIKTHLLTQPPYFKTLNASYTPQTQDLNQNLGFANNTQKFISNIHKL